MWEENMSIILITQTLQKYDRLCNKKQNSTEGNLLAICVWWGEVVHWLVSQAPIIYPNRLWFAGWSARFLLYTPTTSGSLGGQPGSYCIPQPCLVRWVVSQAPIIYPNRPWFAGWSARLLLYTPTASGSLGGQPGSYYIPQLTLVRWVVSSVSPTSWP